MARPGFSTASLLVGILLLTTGCLGGLDVGDQAGEQADPNNPAPTPDREARENSVDADPPERATVALELALTDDSRPPLDVEAVDVDLDRSGSIAVQTTPGRLVPGKTATIAYLHVVPGTDVPSATMEVTLYDGLGQSEIVLHVDGFHAGASLTQTVVLRSQAPGQIGVAEVDGPLEVSARTPHAVPQYGYLLWPDGNREPIPGFDHVIHVPEDFPNVPAGRQVELMAEVPSDEEVLWRLGGNRTVEDRRVTFETEPGVQPVHVSVGPGESTTDLSVHTDLEREVNGTLAVDTPAEQTRERVHSTEHPFEILPGAEWIKLTLRPDRDEPRTHDLDLSLVDENGEAILTDDREDTSRGSITLDPAPDPGEYRAEVQASEGAALNYSVSIHVEY